jgi:tetratricopeptide (TPR) repeat protein
VQSVSLRSEPSPLYPLTTDASVLERRLFLVLGAAALVYAFLAGLKTVSDPDLGWQLATGRWVAQHHHIFSTDVFSYTASGEPWVYPVGSGLVLYAIFLLGGYGLLSWAGAAACLGTVALLLRRGSAFSAGIAILAMPLIAVRTSPRAEMFTVILFAAYLSILWQNYQTSRAPLWCLPLLMLAWVNLHLGFAAGLVLMLAFVGMELLELLSSATRRSQAVQRLKRAIPWFAATALATLANPWGWRIYQALIRQDRAMALHSQVIQEWANLQWSWSGSLSGFSLRDPKGTVTLLLVVVIVAALAALPQRRPGAAILLVGAMYQTTRHIRMQALTACVVVVVGGAILIAAVPQIRLWVPNQRIRALIATAAVAIIATLALVRVADVVSNRMYLATDKRSVFGTGLAWCFPQGAAEFVERENLPGEIFNTYDEGGYLVWKLGLKYRDYFDGRAIPFGAEGFQHEYQLQRTPLDSPLWQHEADRYNINTLIFSLASDEISLLRLKDLCGSTSWQPVYLDEVSAVFLRRTPETEGIINRLQVNCATVPLPLESLDQSARSFHQWVNTAWVLSTFDRNTDALAAADRALMIFPDHELLRWVRGNILNAMDRRPEAEREWLAAISLSPGNAPVWFALGDLYDREGRIPEATHALQQAVQLSSGRTMKSRALLKLARLALVTGQPKAALQALDEAVDNASPEMLEVNEGRSFKFDVAQGRAACWRALGDLTRATSFQEEAVQLDPDAADAWSHLAKLYGRQGRVTDEQRAEERVATLAKGQAQQLDRGPAGQILPSSGNGP